jgi:arylsulfatase A-like enzyme
MKRLLPFTFLATVGYAQTQNVLLVIGDDIGVDAIACYGLGSNPAPTPTIDGLAASGVRFTNAQVCPLCSPTRASILTGRHGFRTGIGRALTNNVNGLAASETLLPEVLATAGIQTALIGKWHLGDDLGPLTPTAEGFGLFTGALQGAINNYYQWPKVKNGTTSTSTTYATTDCVDEALAFIGSTPQPWFLMLAFHAGHTPLHAPPASLHTQNLAGLSPATTPVPFFRAMVQAMDTEFGRLLTTMPAAVRANTNVVFLGDNGTTSQVVQAPFDPQRAKGTVYQGGVKVPLIVAGPAVGGVPRTEASLLHAVDLFTTLAAMQGVNAPAAVPAGVPLDAVNALPLLAAAPAPVREFSYSQEFTGSTAMTASGDSEMIRNAQFALLRFVRPNLTVREELYDLAADPFETTDLMLAPLSPSASAAYTDLERALARLRGYPFTASHGTACSGGGVTPTLASTNAPTIGATWLLNVTGLSTQVLLTVGAVGFQDQSWNGVPLPLALDAAGMTGCTLLVDPALTPVLSQVALTALLPIALPNSSSIVGAALFVQAFPLLPGANPANVLATGAVEAVVGG